MTMVAPKLPVLTWKTDLATFYDALSMLFEPSQALQSIAPNIHSSLEYITAYDLIIDLTVQTLLSRSIGEQSSFISGHARIGEVSNLSALSATEQARVATSPEVLARLELLNALYEKRYPGLRYITFVNGRTRAEIAREIEDKLGLEHSLDAQHPGLDQITPIGDEEAWKSELKRAVEDLGHIAKSRLKVLT